VVPIPEGVERVEEEPEEDFDIGAAKKNEPATGLGIITYS
jgi:hypothetical protein